MVKAARFETVTYSSNLRSSKSSLLRCAICPDHSGSSLHAEGKKILGLLISAGVRWPTTNVYARIPRRLAIIQRRHRSEAHPRILRCCLASRMGNLVGCWRDRANLYCSHSLLRAIAVDIGMGNSMGIPSSWILRLATLSHSVNATILCNYFMPS